MKLKPCKHCDEVDLVMVTGQGGTEGVWVRCQKCRRCSRIKPTEIEAMEDWNVKNETM